jgi:hypothetical protein
MDTHCMLISHVCRFIFLKTLKTAGTSVEIYLEPYCVDPKSYSGEIHHRNRSGVSWVRAAEPTASGITTWRPRG